MLLGWRLSSQDPMDDSVKQMWLEYHQSIGVSENIISRSAVSDIEMIDRTIVDHSVKDESPPTPKFYHFCDNQKDADECAQLVARDKTNDLFPAMGL
jgi:hypothetical protein